jgi:hypothetical protein
MPNILQNHIQHPQHPLVPPIATYIYIYIVQTNGVHFQMPCYYLFPFHHPWCSASVYLLLTKLKLSLNQNIPLVQIFTKDI